MEALARLEPQAASTIYDFCCRFPTPLSVSVSAQRHVLNVFTISADWVQLEPERGKRLRYSQQWIMLMANEAEQTIKSILPAPPCIPKQEEILSCHSPSGTLRAVLRETSCYQFLEIWDCHGLRKSLNLNNFNKHGKIYEDAQFGSLAWSECERRLVYVAEKIQSNETSGTLSSTGNDRSVYCDDWGEGLTCKSLAVLCVANIERGTVSVLKGVPSHVSPGQALWFPGGQALLFVGWWHEPFRLGLKFCSNRRSALFKLELNGNCELLSGDNLSVSSPRLSPDGCSLAYLQGQVFGPHCQCLSLQLYDLQNQTTSTLLDVVHRPTTASSDGFAGVYEALPVSCWSSDSQRIVFSSARRNFKDLFVVDRHTRRVTRLSGSKNPSHSPHPSPPLPRSHLPSSLPPPPPPLPNPRHHEAKKKIEDEEWGSWKLLSVNRDLMVVCCSSPNRPPCLRVGFLPSAGEDVAWQTLGQPAVTVDLSWKVLDVKPSPEEDNQLYSDIDFSSVLVKPPRLHEAKIPLVVYIHGGPHSQFPAEWNISTVGLAMLGFAVLMVNYRGSTGFGQDSILSLIGQIGNQDVKDVHRAVLTALESDITLDSQRVAVIGGSHGGFLSCHLVGQYPDFYKACVARNPVINAATLLGTSDIVDWRYSCVGLQYSFEQLPTPEALATMLEKSPIRHAAQIKAPVLLMLGGRDRRVSPHQGLELYRALKSRGSSIRLLWYAEDGHSLAGVDTQANCFLNMTLWLQRHLNVVEH